MEGILLLVIKYIFFFLNNEKDVGGGIVKGEK